MADIEEEVVIDASPSSDSSPLSTAPEIILKDKRNTTAKVWKYFGLRVDENGKVRDVDNPVCRLCYTPVSAKNGNTSNLYSHLMNQHPEQYKEVKPKVKPGTTMKTASASNSCSIKTAFEKSKKLDTKSPEYKKLTKSITYFLAKDMQPLNAVEQPGLKKMLNAFNPRYEVPSRNYFTRNAIPSLYNEVREKIERNLLTEVTHFSSTTDMWTSRAQDPYISFTIHYIDSNWDLQTHCLQTQYLPNDHTGEVIMDSLTETINNWNLDITNHVCITTDSGSNVIRACTLLGWTRLSCFGHNLDLAIRKGLEDRRVDRVVSVCKQVVSAFTRSWKKSRDLKEVQEEKGLPQHKLKVDVSTRWGSTLDMLHRIVEQQEAIRLVLATDRKLSHLIPNWQDFDVMDSILAALAPLRDMTDLLSGESHITISAVRPLIQHLSSTILSHKDGDSTLTREIKTRVNNDLQRRYSSDEINQLISVCSVIDPRFKLSSLDSSEHTSIKECIKEEMDALSSDVSVQELQDDADECEQPLPKKPKYGLGQILGSSYSSSSSCKQITTSEELDMYLQLPNEDIDSSPLAWWKNNNKKFPSLSKVAKKYLCICATSVASERVFSTGGDIVTPSRSCLKPQRVDQLVFLAKNLQ